MKIGFIYNLGIEHCKIFGEKLQSCGRNPSIFLTSPYQRCRKTLEYIQNGWGVQAEIQEELLLANAVAGNDGLGHETLLNSGAFA